MTIQKRISALLLALALGFSLAACTGEPAADSEEPIASQEVAGGDDDEVDLTQDILSYAAGLSAGDPLLTVGSQEVPADLYLYWLALNCTYFNYNYSAYAAYGFTVSAYADYLLSSTTSMAAAYTLIEQKCQQYGCLLTDDQQAEVETSMYSEGDEAYARTKALYGLSDESVRSIYSISYYYQNLLDALVPIPSENDLNQYVFAVKHILLKTTAADKTDDEGNITQTADEYNAAQKELAESLLAQLQESDDMEALFDELMDQYSEDGRDSDGNLAAPDGYTFTASDSLVDGFREASLELDFGQLSGVVQTDYGYHIILRGQVDDLDSYTDSCREYQLDTLVDQWLDASDITETDALTSLDVADFYDRYAAYQQALQAQFDAEDGADSADADS